MIKNLLGDKESDADRETRLGADEARRGQTAEDGHPDREDTGSADTPLSANADDPSQSPGGETRRGGQQDGGAAAGSISRRTEELEKKLHEIEEELRRERESEAAPKTENGGELTSETQSPVAAEVIERKISKDEDVFTPFSAAALETSTETARNGGLAWSAAIALFGSVAFLLVLGWFADLVFGSAPWGKVAGIILGAVIGFVQFFRITAQINNPHASDLQELHLSSDPAPEDKPDKKEGPISIFDDES